MSKTVLRSAGIAAVVAAACLSGASVHAQSEAEFYKGKAVSFVVSTGAGGGYDSLARGLARHLPKYIPGQPNIIVQNMPGGGHMLAANYMYSVAPKDGTVIAALNQNVPSNQVLKSAGVRYDAGQYIWLGRFTEGNPVMAVWHTVPVKTVDDARETEVLIGATGEGSSSFRYTTAMNKVLGTKFRIIKGYKTVPELLIAIERGEIQGRAGGLSAFIDAKPDWLKEKKLRFLAQIGASRDPELSDVPLWTDVAKTEEQRQVLRLVAAPTSLGRPVNTTPGVPESRVAALRKALEQTVKDKAFIEEGAKQNFETEFRDHADTEAIVRDTLSASPDVVAKAVAAMKD